MIASLSVSVSLSLQLFFFFVFEQNRSRNSIKHVMMMMQSCNHRLVIILIQQEKHFTHTHISRWIVHVMHMLPPCNNLLLNHNIYIYIIMIRMYVPFKRGNTFRPFAMRLSHIFSKNNFHLSSTPLHSPYISHHTHAPLSLSFCNPFTVWSLFFFAPHNIILSYSVRSLSCDVIHTHTHTQI